MDELNHHGIKGMKWGVRRTPEQLGHKRFKKKMRAAMDRAQAKLDESKKRRAEESEVRKAERAKQAEVRKAEREREAERSRVQKAEQRERAAMMRKKPSEMTDEELRTRYNRLMLEDNYSQLVARAQTREPGGVGEWLKGQVTKSAKSFGERTFSYLVDAAFDKLSAPKLGDYEIDDTSKATTKRLNEATNWYNARNNYEEARSKSKKPKGGSAGEAEFGGKKLSGMSDDELSKLADRLKKEAAIKRDLDFLSGKDNNKKSK